ncbi:MAG: YhcH/YjgK/YiaL family protein [Sphaerochaetaceae bacterium]|nr:YhcH/YjgK/YiaL family protein [Sphaerochaetaceae bacterium]
MIFDNLDNLETYIPVLPALRQIADIMDHDDLYEKEVGHYTTKNEKISYSISQYLTSTTDKPFEFHGEYSVVQIVLKGSELVSTSWREMAKNADAYSKKDDTGFFQGNPISVFQATQGRFMVFLPGEPYKSGVASGESSLVKKVTFKVVD